MHPQNPMFRGSKVHYSTRAFYYSSVSCQAQNLNIVKVNNFGEVLTFNLGWDTYWISSIKLDTLLNNLCYPVLIVGLKKYGSDISNIVLNIWRYSAAMLLSLPFLLFSFPFSQNWSNFRTFWYFSVRAYEQILHIQFSGDLSRNVLLSNFSS